MHDILSTAAFVGFIIVIGFCMAAIDIWNNRRIRKARQELDR